MIEKVTFKVRSDISNLKNSFRLFYFLFFLQIKELNNKTTQDIFRENKIKMLSMVFSCF